MKQPYWTASNEGPDPEEWNDLRAPSTEWPWPDDFHYYQSGTNQRARFLAQAERETNPGTTTEELSDDLVQDMIEILLRHKGAKLFVDNGAFPEMVEKDNKPTWPKPITDAQWVRRLGWYDRFARALGPRVLLVLPDQVASQQGTLARLAAYADEIRAIMSHGAHAVLALQGGEWDRAEFWRVCMSVLEGNGVPNLDKVRPGLPLTVKARPPPDDEIADILRRLDPRPEAVHFLGRGVQSEKYAGTFRAATRVLPGLQVSSDSKNVTGKMMGARTRTMGPYLIAFDALKDLGLPPREVERMAWHMALDAMDDKKLIQALAAGSYDENSGVESGLEQLQELARDEVESTVEQLVDPDWWKKR
ncbi:MAG: hypothetical protein WC969_15515 [Elusimicrobiota bacterium]|jgi:hypothetical protein